MAVEGVFRDSRQGIVRKTFPRPRTETIEAFRRTYSAFVLDHFGKEGAMDPAIAPLGPGQFVCGPAVTALGPDLTVRRMAIDTARPGDILVVAAGGLHNRACFGDGTSLKMMKLGLSGAVIDGATRDRDGILKLGFPVFCRGATPRNRHYPEEGLHGGVNVPVVCGGVLVKPGDMIIADGDGVVCVDREAADAIVPTLLSNLDAEQAERAGIDDFTGFDVEPEMLKRGYTILP